MIKYKRPLTILSNMMELYNKKIKTKLIRELINLAKEKLMELLLLNSQQEEHQS